MEDALKIIRYYGSRRLIEDLFRTVKSEGASFEASELERGKALRKLFVMPYGGDTDTAIAAGAGREQRAKNGTCV